MYGRIIMCVMYNVWQDWSVCLTTGYTVLMWTLATDCDGGVNGGLPSRNHVKFETPIT
jgi:hypothetical protein